MITKIQLEDIKIHACHGVLKEENIIGAEYLICVEVTADFSEAIESDELKDTINYAEINAIIHQEMKIPSRLIEHVGGRILRKIKKEFPHAKRIKVKITKKSPPMKGEMKGASIEIEETF
ncbi:MAG: dihydroneopterin aldolase [Bergeyella sp.]|nr:dihydroneopterin aldolase [Bergeyella sp.]